MDLKRKTTSRSLYDDIKKDIESGKLKRDEPVMSGPQLCDAYKLSYPTVNKVLNDLVKDNLLYRIKGKGTFVAQTDVTSASTKSQFVGLVVRTKGHLFEVVYKSLVVNLQEAGFWPVTLDYSTDSFQKSPERKWHELLDMNLSALIIEGVYDFPYKLLAQNEDKIKNLLFINRFESTQDIKSDKVIGDYEYGGYLAMKHLLELGHRNIAVEALLDRPITNQYFTQKVRGCRNALLEYGLSNESMTIINPSQNFIKKQLKAAFTKKDHPTAVLAINDFHAKTIIDELKTYKLNVPDDVSVIGYFNTPWAEMLETPLTSVSIREGEIARHAVKRISELQICDKQPNVKILVEPELIKRDSCRKID